MPTKVVYNDCFGGFDLSDEARRLYEERTGNEFSYDIDRHNPTLVDIVEELGARANSPYSDLVIGLCYGDEYRIDEYDGNEMLSEDYGSMDGDSDECLRWFKID